MPGLISARKDHTLCHLPLPPQDNHFEASSDDDNHLLQRSTPIPVMRNDEKLVGILLDLIPLGLSSSCARMLVLNCHG